MRHMFYDIKRVLLGVHESSEFKYREVIIEARRDMIEHALDLHTQIML